jgi:hypothetical protein
LKRWQDSFGVTYCFLLILFVLSQKEAKKTRPSECSQRTQKKCLKQYQSSGLITQTTSAFGLFSTHFFLHSHAGPPTWSGQRTSTIELSVQTGKIPTSV